MNGRPASDPVRSWIEAHRDELVGFLATCVSIDSTTGNELELARHCAGWLQAHGIEAILQPCKGRSNVVGVLGEGDPTLIVSGHLDTVPARAEEWTYGPHVPKVVDGRMYGLGTSDMKASLAAAYMACVYLREKGYELPGRLLTVFTIEEETTGDGTRSFLDWAAETSFLDPARTSCVITEPTGMEHLCLGNRASIFVDVHVEGRGGHGSRPHLARNPIPKLLAILADVPALAADLAERYSDPDLGVPTLTPTSIAAGGRSGPNVIPQHASAGLDCRLTPRLWEHRFQRFRAELDAFLDSRAEEGFRIRREERFGRVGHKLAADHPLATMALSVLHEDMGLPHVGIAPNPAGNDACFFGARGIATLNKIGPGHPACAHRVDEYVELASLLSGAELYLRLALRFFGLEPR